MVESFKNNPFEGALRGFKAAASDKRAEPDVVQEEKSPIEQPAAAETQENVDPQTGLTLEDQLLFEQIASALKLNPNRRSDANRYWRIRDAIRDSYRHDVSFNLNRWTRSFGNENLLITPILEQIKRRGFEAHARRWVHSLTPEGMKFGTGSRELRIEEARKYAKLAGVDVELLAKEQGVEI